MYKGQLKSSEQYRKYLYNISNINKKLTKYLIQIMENTEQKLNK